MKSSTGQLELIKGGLQCSIQDAGRVGFAQYGVPYSGAMDRHSFHMANRLLGNNENDACLEIGPAPTQFIFNGSTWFVITGADAEVLLNGSLIHKNKPYFASEKAVLNISTFTKGNWIYLSVIKGFISDIYLSSKSWSKGITPINQARKNTQFSFHSNQSMIHWPQHVRVKEQLRDNENLTLTAHRGGDWEMLPNSIKLAISDQVFKLGLGQDRMGYEINGLGPNKLPELLTAPVFPGTIQLTPSGKMIALMREAQVTGGYPRVLQLTEDAINTLSQQKPSTQLRFHLL